MNLTKDVGRTSLTTPVSFTLASSSTFWMRRMCWAISRTSCLRVRVRSRSSGARPAIPSAGAPDFWRPALVERLDTLPGI